jgi:hypothetical protein
MVFPFNREKLFKCAPVSGIAAFTISGMDIAAMPANADFLKKLRLFISLLK